jgi:hypothetical protein
MVQLKLSFDDTPDTGVRAFEVYTFKDRDNKVGYEGHVRFVAACDIKEARHRVAFDFPRFWMWCGIQEVKTSYLKSQVEVFNTQLSRAECALMEVNDGETRFP